MSSRISEIVRRARRTTSIGYDVKTRCAETRTIARRTGAKTKRGVFVRKVYVTTTNDEHSAEKRVAQDEQRASGTTQKLGARRRERRRDV